MTWNDTAVVSQLLQLARAHAWLVWSTSLPSVTQTSASAESKTEEPSVVLTAIAWLSPSVGGAGGSNQKGQSGRVPGCVGTCGATPPPPAAGLGSTTTIHWPSAAGEAAAGAGAAGGGADGGAVNERSTAGQTGESRAMCSFGWI